MNGMNSKLRQLLNKLQSNVMEHATKIQVSKTADERDKLKNEIPRIAEGMAKVIEGIYRPYCKKLLFFDRILNEEIYQLTSIFPLHAENQAICCTVHSQIEFSALAVNLLPDHGLGQRAGQIFPFSIYTAGDATPRENLKDEALNLFQKQYSNSGLTKRQIFHYIYALLHHPEYRSKYADNLKRELPRIPFAPDINAFAEFGAKLARLHLDYELVEQYPLEEIKNPIHPRSFRVESAMRYTNKEKTAILVNDYLTLVGIPPEVHEYRVGSRSALDWIVEMYRITDDKRSGIRQDPNRPDDPEYIVNLIGRITRLSLETVSLVQQIGQLPYTA